MFLLVGQFPNVYNNPAWLCRGNLLAARAAHLPLLLSFFRSLLGSLLERRPAARLTARLARQQATLIFEQIFSANQFFRPKIGSK